MFECTVHLWFSPETLDRVLSILRNEALPMLKQQPGLCGLGLLADPDTGRVTILSAWLSQAAARRAEAAPEFQAPMRALDRLAIAAPTATHMLSPDQALDGVSRG